MWIWCGIATPGKELHSTPMTREAERCQLALELARGGKTVAMVCSGDSGIYGMAALVYELRGEAQEPEIQVVPGLTAACSAAAVLGAPLTHDFRGHQSQRSADAVGNHRKAAGLRGGGGSDHRPV